MSTIHEAITRHCAAAYFLLVFAISWCGVILVIGSGGLTSAAPSGDPRFVYALAAMLAGPATAGLLVTGLVHGRAGLRTFLSRATKWRVNLRWYAVALLTAPLMMGTTLAALSLFSPAFVPGFMTSEERATLLLVSLGVGLAAGLFEEIGWTGFAIPSLRSRYSVLRTGIYVGVIWGAWHLLTNVFWASRVSAGDLPLSIFLPISVVGTLIGYLTAYRILMVWVYDHTQSLPIAILMHVSLTASLLSLNPIGLSGAALLTYSHVLAAGFWFLVAVIAAIDMKHAGRTRPFRGPHGQPMPASIAEIRYYRLGGVDQWVMMRGEDIAHPPLILLHGGPGMTEMRLFRRFNAPLEKCFTVVNWDQRGAGKSFDRTLDPSSMTVEQFISDLDELVEIVRARLGHQKVVLFGHSWGSALGALYAARFPEKVAIYIGCEQVGDSAVGESLSYQFALSEARRLHDRKALKALLAIGPPPHSASDLLTERTTLQRLTKETNLRVLWQMSRIFLGGPESSAFDLGNILRGFRFSQHAMWSEVSRLNLMRQVPALKMPVFFFVGRRDHWVPPEASVAYFNALSAPSKGLIWFDESGHEPFMDEPSKFNAVMATTVRAAVDDALSRGVTAPTAEHALAHT